MLLQATVEAAAVGEGAVPVLGAGLGGAREDPRGALLPDGGAEAGPELVVDEGLVVGLAAVGLALGGLAPVAAVGGRGDPGPGVVPAKLEGRVIAGPGGSLGGCGDGRHQGQTKHHLH